VPPFLNFAPLENGFAALQRTTELYDKALAQAMENDGGRAGPCRAERRQRQAGRGGARTDVE
jgi:hypothetical protein